MPKNLNFSFSLPMANLILKKAEIIYIFLFLQYLMGRILESRHVFPIAISCLLIVLPGSVGSSTMKASVSAATDFSICTSP
jgi:hypothetical protein